MKPRRIAVLGMSSWFGLGYLPLAPGTWGTVGALPLWWAMAQLGWFEQIAAVFGFTLFAIWISAKADAIYGLHDVGKIVIDEVAGLLATVIAVPFNWRLAISGFLLFRLLDIVKPGPIAWVDRRIKGGVGVVLDDTIAGLLGCAILHAAHWLNGGWW